MPSNNSDIPNITNNQCSGNDFINFQENYSYRPISYPISYLCPNGYSKVGINCMKTITKTNLEEGESYDENNNMIQFFDKDKKAIFNKTEQNPNPDEYIIKSCPLVHPTERDLLLNQDESNKDITTSSRNCVYNKNISRTVYHKSDCFDYCDNDDESLRCGTMDNRKTIDDIRQCIVNEFGEGARNWKPKAGTCPNGWTSTGPWTCIKSGCPENQGYRNDPATCWWDSDDTRGEYCESHIPNADCNGIFYRETPRLAVGGAGGWCDNSPQWPWDLKTKPANITCRPGYSLWGGLCYKNCPAGWWRSASCTCTRGGHPPAPFGYTDGGRNIIWKESRGIHNCRLAIGAAHFFDMMGKLGKEGAANEFGPLICGAKCPEGYESNDLTCKKERKFKLCYPERKIEKNEPSKMWKEYCKRGNNLTADDNECKDALANSYISSVDFNNIYKDKCEKKIDRSVLSDTQDIFGNKGLKNKILYTTIAQLCYEVNKDETFEKPTPNSFYKLNIPIPILDIDKTKPKGIYNNTKELSDAFDRFNLIIDRDILKAIKTGEFICKYELTKCDDDIKAYFLTFIRVRYAAKSDDCCINMDNVNLDGSAINYYVDVNNELINESDNNVMHFQKDLFGSKTTCDPKIKKIEGTDTCRTALNEFCEDTNDKDIPHIIEYTDESQRTLKHKRCGIDFQKRYKYDYDTMIKRICDDYNPIEKKDFIVTNNVCKDYCKDDMSNCKSGFEKYCIQTGIFKEKCKEFIDKLPNKDKIYETMCVKTTSSNVYNDDKCKEYKKSYDKCLVNEKGNKECDNFYKENPNITRKIFNNDCDNNPTLSYCDKNIIQQDMYKNEYISSSNKKEAAKNIINSDPKRYFKTSEENLIDDRKNQIDKEMTKEKIKFCLDDSKYTSKCQTNIENYMKSDFIMDCVKGKKDSFINDNFCINIKNSNKTNFPKYIRQYCNDRDSAVYDTTECIKFRSDNEKNKRKKYGVYIIIGVIIFFIFIALFKKAFSI
jgi:hypothetical protein